MSDVDVAQSLDPSADTRPWLSLTQAAAAAGVSHKTIRRALDAGRLPQARRGSGPGGPGTGSWAVPVDDLLAAGFKLGRPAPPDDSGASSTAAPTQGRDIPTDTVVLDRLQAENADLRARLAVAEAVAAERGRHLTNLEVALRALPAGTEQSRLSWRQRRKLAKAADVSRRPDVTR